MELANIVEKIEEIRDRIASDSITLPAIISFLNQTISDMVECLNECKHIQLIASYGDRSANNVKKLRSISENLDTAQMVFEGCADILKELLTNERHFATGEYSHQVFQTLKRLVNLCFILEEQPKQVLQKFSVFKATVRVLLGPNFIEDLGTVKVFMSSRTSESCGEFQETDDKWEIRSTQCPDLRNYVCCLRQVRMKSLEKPTTPDGENPIDEKFFLRFQLRIQIYGYTFTVETKSFPIFITMNLKQESRAWGNVVWDNAFFTTNSNSFDLVDEIPWSTMKVELRRKFESYTGCLLSDAHLHYLCEKVFRNIIPESGILTRRQYSQDYLNGAFTFAEWFYDAMLLTRLCLRAEWNDGLIAGFITRNDAIKVLNKRPFGTFLLRFADSIRGSISVACVKENARGATFVDNLQPFAQKQFENPGFITMDRLHPKYWRTVGDMIKNVRHCCYLYPSEIPKNTAFGRYYTTKRSIGYTSIEC